MTITKESARLYKFLKDESCRDECSFFQNKILYCIRDIYYNDNSVARIYDGFNRIMDYSITHVPILNNECRKFDDL